MKKLTFPAPKTEVFFARHYFITEEKNFETNFNVYKPSHKKSHFTKNRHILQKDNNFQW